MLYIGDPFVYVAAVPSSTSLQSRRPRRTVSLLGSYRLTTRYYISLGSAFRSAPTGSRLSTRLQDCADWFPPTSRRSTRLPDCANWLPPTSQRPTCLPDCADKFPSSGLRRQAPACRLCRLVPVADIPDCANLSPSSTSQTVLTCPIRIHPVQTFSVTCWGKKVVEC